MAAGDVQGIVDYTYNYEHPPLSKLVYGATILPLPSGAAAAGKILHPSAGK